MKYFTTVHDVSSPAGLVSGALQLKQDPLGSRVAGMNKTLGLVFMNPSLRTRISTQKAAMNLGMNVIVMNIGQDGWALEMEEGAVMSGNRQEHVKDAAAVIGSYCDIVGIRCFASLTDRDSDYSEHTLQQFMKYCNKPLLSLESATLHPLQSLADAITIRENSRAGVRPKVVLSWAPHVRPLPQAVANSFVEWMQQSEVDLVVTHPEGYELADRFSSGVQVTHSQEEALKGADFVYVKNWSAYSDYGSMPPVKDNWMLSEEKLQAGNDPFIMHCLPVRRNVELPDALMDGGRSLVLQQAVNREFAAQVVLRSMIENSGESFNAMKEERVECKS